MGILDTQQQLQLSRFLGHLNPVGRGQIISCGKTQALWPGTLSAGPLCSYVSRPQ